MQDWPKESFRPPFWESQRGGGPLTERIQKIKHPPDNSRKHLYSSRGPSRVPMSNEGNRWNPPRQ